MSKPFGHDKQQYTWALFLPFAPCSRLDRGVCGVHSVVEPPGHKCALCISGAVRPHLQESSLTRLRALVRSKHAKDAQPATHLDAVEHLSAWRFLYGGGVDP